MQDKQNSITKGQEFLDIQAQQNRFQFIHAGDLIRNIKPPEWVIKDCLEADAIAVIYSPPGTGKSFVAMDMSACIATGKEWHGKRTKQGAAFYIAGEGHNGIACRIRAWEISNEADLSQASFYVSTLAVPLDDPASAHDVKQRIEALAKATGEKPSIIVVDTLARNFAGDENSTQNMNSFINSIDDMRREWQATVLIVHHSGKDRDRGARGSTVLNGAINVEYSLSMDSNKVITMHNHKMKEADLQPDKFFKLNGVRLTDSENLPLLDEDGLQVWSCVTTKVDDDYEPPKKVQARGKNQSTALQALRAIAERQRKNLIDSGRDASEIRVSVDDWRDECEAHGLKRNRFHEVKHSLSESGQVDISGIYALVGDDL